MVEGGQSDGRLARSTGTDKTDGSELSCQMDNFFNQLVTSEAGPRRRGRRFTERAKNKYKIMDPLAVQIADLV